MNCPEQMTFAHHQAFGHVGPTFDIHNAVRASACPVFETHRAEVIDEIDRLRKSNSPWSHKAADELALALPREPDRKGGA